MCAARTPPLALVFRGTFVHSTWTCPMEVLRDHLLGVSDSGKIVFLEESSQQEKLAKEWCFKPCEIRELSHHEFFMPGLVDTHIHAPQYAFAGSNVDLPLLEWLNKYTFPTEQRFRSTDVAEEVYTRVVRRTLKNGTTTACYFGTIHTDSSLILAEITDKFGQRAFVGKVCMDLNDTVPEYKETTEESVKETERFVSEMLQKNYPRVKPIVTPRFTLSCTETLMSELGNIAKTHDLYIQSHISENREEIEAVKSLYPSYKNYTDVYDKNNLLTNKTVMAHGCYLSEEELNIFSERGASIAHCPNSNLSLSSGLLNVLEVLKHKVKIGLGTDVAGGYSYSMLDAIRRAVMVSNVLLINKVNEKNLTLKEVFRLATLGGSQALGLDSEIGNFEVGKEFDALLINPRASDSPIDLFYGDFVGDISEAVIQKFLYLGDDRNIEEVYVGGKQVVPFSSSV
ncbi:guanine deaminase [Mus musculus]|uniref:Guanine deaminase n=8 Tax=Mus TaxID=862507 RepID=GUAD_MOUSE|nr:guanine deaminase [Mus musculus]Q9R111.1 RecName: Full=Guanine deaminase; Short=Guanase; Short=Guanine aminase; AltName: Full=Guanine aminohydrolase; Short=GAH [Mus musculus]AAM18372.1 guanine deaminase [Mus musculus molossinus]AAM18373.1 guanine deaminase [Mus musculus castaneus]AAD50297.1 guanine deaminase [Mus musculus]AAM18369.1 guanine deaminase [Mus musculus]AAM18370.1 guanine deaminase [Mus musculus]|eukprot:NP_034396.1 guanine deaminase [Mus musculus]